MHSHLQQSDVTLRGRFPGTSSLTMGHIVMSNLPERVSEPNDTDPWARAVVSVSRISFRDWPCSRENFQGTKIQIPPFQVNTPLVEFFVSNTKTNTTYDITVELSFKHLRPKTKKSFVKCVFFKPESE